MAMRVQSILFDRRRWSPRRASAWVRRHGFRPHGELRESANKIRARLRSPNVCKRGTYATLVESMPPGVEMIACRVKAPRNPGAFITGRRPRKNRCRTLGNPATGPRIYPRIRAIEAEKNGQVYRHTFKTDAPILGLPDGSLLIPAKRGRPLWGAFDG